MYSPKISKDLVPKIYRLSKAKNKPMTKIVDEILRDYFTKMEFYHTKQVKEFKITDYLSERKGDKNKVEEKSGGT